MHLLLLLALSVPASQTWTIDDDGPADFAEIADAIDAVVPGDVLLVEPGTYAGFDLDKRLTILGRAGSVRPLVNGQLSISAQSFTVAGLDIDRLLVNGVGGRGRIDDCRINVPDNFQQEFAASIDGCAELVISRTTVYGSKAYSESVGKGPPGGSAMSIRTSRVTLVECELKGAKGYDADSGEDYGGMGGIGLQLADSSQVVVAGGKILGGYEGWSGCTFCNCHDGPGGPAVKLAHSYLIVRGAGGDEIIGGEGDGLCVSQIGAAFDATGSVIVVSGVVTWGNQDLIGTQMLFPSPPEPFLASGGSDKPGGVHAFRLHGPAGMTAFLAASLSPSLHELGKFEGKLWLDPAMLSLVVPVLMTGHYSPVALNWTVPASTVGLEGLAVEVQAFFPAFSGALDPTKALAGNVAELIVRF